MAIVAAIVLLAGATFTGQGVGVIRGQSAIGRSFMVGDPVWAMIGMAMVAAALLAFGLVLKRRAP